jgi:hypothetical protein
MKYEAAGDPMTGTKGLRRTPEKCAQLLTHSGIQVSRNTVARLLKDLGFSLQVNRKAIAIESSPDRDQQFGVIRAQRESFEAAGCPIISVDTKKKELIGLFLNPGRVWTRQPVQVYDHDFRSAATAIALPYGIYDIQANQGFVFVGTSSETPEFAVNSIEKWWRLHGRTAYPGRHELLILADGGGVNGCRARAWKHGIQGKLADRYKLIVTVAHYPTGASKWNPVEHRLFSEISKNWAGHPLDTLDTMLKYIKTTKTTGGLKVKSYPDTKEYQKGVKIPDKEMNELSLERADVLDKWNYTIFPN